MRFFSFIGLLLLFVGTGLILAQDSKINFAGEWILDMDKSEFTGGHGGRRGGMAAVKMVVQQEENKLVVESFRRNRDGEEMATVAIYTLDGEESENETNNSTSISTAEWSEDGNSLEIFSEINITMNGREFSMESETIWSLNENKLILESSRSTPMGDMDSKMVYNKAEKKQ